MAQASDTAQYDGMPRSCIGTGMIDYVLPERMRDRYDLFGSLPDTIKDESIDDIETLGEKMDEYINAQKQATGFDLRYTTTMEPSEMVV
jgi:hypothetical protein